MQAQQILTDMFGDVAVLSALPGFVVHLILAALLGFLLGKAYVRFGKSPSNRRAFASNFLMLAVTTALIISIVKSSLALSLGLVGALSIVRFRAAIKEPEELAYLFVAIGIGLGIGAGQVAITVLAVLFILTLVAVRGAMSKRQDVPNLYLSVTSPAASKLTAGKILEVLKAVGATARLSRLDETPEQMEALVEIGLKDDASLEEISKRLRELSDGVRISYLADRAAGAEMRYERKYLPIGESLAGVIARVRLHPALFREAFPPRVVNSVYLDSAGLSDYRDHVRGAPQRAKTRVRWYGDVEGHIARPRLERKFKVGSVGGKETHALPPLDIALGNNKVRAALEGLEVSDSIRTILWQLRPVVMTRYLRHYFVNAEGNIRITVDSELQFIGVGTAKSRSARVRPPADYRIVLELKYDVTLAEAAGSIAAGMPYSLGRCSKYVLGIEGLAAQG